MDDLFLPTSKVVAFSAIVLQNSFINSCSSYKLLHFLFSFRVKNILESVNPVMNGDFPTLGSNAILPKLEERRYIAIAESLFPRILYFSRKS